LSTGFKFEIDGTKEVLPSIVHPSGKGALNLFFQGSDDLEVAVDWPPFIWENDYMDNAQWLCTAFHEVKERILTDCVVAVHEKNR